MSVPFLDLGEQYNEIADEVRAVEQDPRVVGIGRVRQLAKQAHERVLATGDRFHLCATGRESLRA